MATMYFRKKTLLAKLEGSYGGDSSPIPTGASNAILTTNMQIEPYGGPTVTREYDTSTLGAKGQINTSPMVRLTFGIELAGSGTAGTAPKWDPLIRACGFTQTIPSPASSVTYTPLDSSFPSASLYFYMDGQFHKVLGARGNVSFSLARGQLPTMNFEFMGQYTRAVAGSAAGVDTSGFQAPVAVTNTNTPTFKFGPNNTSPIVYKDYNAESFTFDMGNNVVHRNIVNSNTISITDRNVTGNMVIEAPDLDASPLGQNLFAQVESDSSVTYQDLQVVHGTVAGNIITITAPRVQLANIAMNDSDGVLVYAIDTIFTPNAAAGNDEVSIKLT